jgi:hypothetical protein
VNGRLKERFRGLLAEAPATAVGILQEMGERECDVIADGAIDELLGNDVDVVEGQIDVVLEGWDLTRVPTGVTSVAATVKLNGWYRFRGSIAMHRSLTRLELTDVPALEDELLTEALTAPSCSLDSLRLSAAPLLTGVGWYPAALALPTLTMMTLADCARVGSVPLDINASSGRMSQLSFSRCASTTDVLIVHTLAACPSLALLDLSFNPLLTERSFLAIVASKALPTLKVLICWDFPEVRPAAVAMLARRARSLKTLSLGSVAGALDERSVVSLLASTSTTLSSLTLWSCPLVTSTATRLTLSTATHLTSLSLVSLPALSDGALAGVLASLSLSLSDLTLKDLSIGNGALEGVGGMKMNALTISKCPRVGWGERERERERQGGRGREREGDGEGEGEGWVVEGLAAVLSRCPRLRSLSLPASPGLSDSLGLTLGASVSPPTLRSLNLQGAQGLGERELQGWLSASPSLSHLVLDGAAATVLSPLLSHPTPLSSLSVNWIPTLSLSPLPLSPHLTSLSLAGCLSLTDAQLLPSLSLSLPTLRTLNLSACHSLSPSLWLSLSLSRTAINWLALAQVPNIFNVQGREREREREALARFFRGRPARHLRRLDVTGATPLPPSLLLSLSSSAPCLRELNLTGIPLSSRVIRRIVGGGERSLREVRVSGVEREGWSEWPLINVIVKD